MTHTFTSERAFRAMGTDCTIVMYGSDPRIGDLVDLAQRRVDLLESLWSRFRPDSELNRLNDSAGSGPVGVSAETEGLIRAMCSGWERTEGAFDPTVLAAVRAGGYDRDFAEVLASDFVSAASAPSPGMADVRVGDRVVWLPRGVGVDPGAIGKGLAADIIVDEMMEAGATGVLVDLGGDIAFAGYPGDESHWRISIADERSVAIGTKAQADRHYLVAAGVGHAGIATSTSLTRRWAQGRHHVVDPDTGSSTSEELVQATVGGGRAWECEVWATAVLVRPGMVSRLPEGMSCAAFTPGAIVRDDFSMNLHEDKVA